MIRESDRRGRAMRGHAYSNFRDGLRQCGKRWYLPIFFSLGGPGAAPLLPQYCRTSRPRSPIRWAVGRGSPLRCKLDVAILWGSRRMRRFGVLRKGFTLSDQDFRGTSHPESGHQLKAPSFARSRIGRKASTFSAFATGGERQRPSPRQVRQAAWVLSLQLAVLLQGRKHSQVTQGRDA